MDLFEGKYGRRNMDGKLEEGEFKGEQHEDKFIRPKEEVPEENRVDLEKYLLR